MVSVLCSYNNFFNVQKIACRTAHVSVLYKQCFLLLLKDIFEGDLKDYVSDEDKKVWNKIKRGCYPNINLSF